MIRPGIARLLPAVWLTASLVSACAGFGSGPGASGPPGQVEIRRYQGQDLSAVGEIPGTDIAGVQHVSLDTYRLKVSGLVNTTLEMSYERVLSYAHSSKVVTLHCVEGWDATILWEGVRIEDILADAGVRDGAPVVIFHAVDGYTSSLPLAFIQANHILLAFNMNGLPLSAANGFPFQVVAESRWGYKWVRWVDGIELSDDTSYRGYWESRGYSNDGDENGPMFEP